MIDWENIQAGDTIPVLEKRPDYVQLFMFSAVTWNRHLIHYNQDYAHHDGLKDVAVHRALQGNYLAQLLTDWLGESGRIKRIEWSVRSSAKPGDSLICSGTITDKRQEQSQRLLDLDIRIENSEQTLIAPGKATVLLFDIT